MIADHRHVAANVLTPISTSSAATTRENSRYQYPLTLLDIGHVGTRLFHGSRRLMPQHNRRLLECRHAVFDVVQVGMAHATRRDLDQNLILADLRNRDILNLQSLLATVKYHCFHMLIPFNSYHRDRGDRRGKGM